MELLCECLSEEGVWKRGTIKRVNLSEEIWYCYVDSERESATSVHHVSFCIALTSIVRVNCIRELIFSIHVLAVVGKLVGTFRA